MYFKLEYEYIRLFLVNNTKQNKITKNKSEYLILIVILIIDLTTSSAI